MPIEHKRSVEDFWDVAMTLPKRAAVDTLEYFGWNHGPKKLHHFLCATIKLPRGTILKAIIQRSPMEDAPPSKLVGSKECTAEDYFVIFNRDNAIFDNKPTLRGVQRWCADKGPGLLEVAAVAKAVSESAACYQLYKSQCIWYALTIFDLIAQEFHGKCSPVDLVGTTESTVRQVMVKNNYIHLSRMFRQNLEANTSHPSTAGAGSCIILPSTEFPARMDLITAVDSAQNWDLASTDLSSKVGATTTTSY